MGIHVVYDPCSICWLKVFQNNCHRESWDRLNHSTKHKQHKCNLSQITRIRVVYVVHWSTSICFLLFVPHRERDTERELMGGRRGGGLTL